MPASSTARATVSSAAGATNMGVVYEVGNHLVQMGKRIALLSGSNGSSLSGVVYVGGRCSS